MNDEFDDSFLNRIMRIESGGNPRARTGSYKGLFQLSDDEFNRYGGGDIYDPDDNRNAAIRKLGAEREMFRKRYGEEPSPTDLYMMHQQGEAGYAAHRANPDAPAWQNMASTGEGRQKGTGWARQAIWGNIPDNLKRQFGSVDNVTSADFINLWRGKVEGGGNAEEVRDAAPIGGGIPENYDTEDRTAVGLGGNRAYAPEADAFTSTGQKRMANGDATGILGALGMQNQQPQGLLGALGDPETMAYIGMMLKGMNPYSNIDPNAMLSAAHTNALKKEALRQQRAEQAIDNQRADRALQMRADEHGWTRADRERKIALDEAQRKADAEAFQELTGTKSVTPPTTAAPTEVAGAVPGMDQEFNPFQPRDPTAFDAVKPSETPASRALNVEEKVDIIDKRLAKGGLTDRGEQQLIREKERLLRPTKDPNTTASINELKVINEARVRRGERPLDLDEWILQSKTAGAMRIGETTADKLSAERADKIMQSASGASGELAKLSQLENRLDQFQSGALASTKMTVGAWANALGIPDDQLKKLGMDSKSVATMQSVQAMVNRQLVDQIGQGKFPANNFSDADRAFLQDSLTKLSNLPGANKDIIEIARRAETRNLEKGKAYMAWRRDPQNRGRSPDEFELAWADQMEKSDLFGDLRQKYQGALGGGGGEGGWTVIDGVRIRKK